MDSNPANDWLELAQDGEIDRALDRLAAVSPTVAMRELRLHLQLQALSLAPVGVLAPELPAPRLSIDWSAIERRWNALTAVEDEALRDAAVTAAREIRLANTGRHSNMQSAIGAEAEDLRLHLQLQELAMETAQAASVGATGPRLTIDWQAVAHRSRRMTLDQQRELREAATQAMGDLHAPAATAAVAPARTGWLERLHWRGWAAAAALFLAGFGLYRLTQVAPSASQVLVVPRQLPPALAQVPQPDLERPETLSQASAAVENRPGKFRLPLGTLAAVDEDGRIEVTPGSNTVERVTQSAGRVQYVIGATPVAVCMPQGQVTGADADLTVALGGAGGLSLVTVTRGEAIVYDGDHRQFIVRAGQTGYLASSGAVQVLASRDPAPEFPLPAPQAPTVTPFHPTDAAPETVALPELPAPAVPAVTTVAAPPENTGSTAQAATAAAVPPPVPPAPPAAPLPVAPAAPAALAALADDPAPTADLPPVDEAPPTELPPSDLAVGSGQRGVGNQFALPSTPEPSGSGNGNGNGHGNGWAGGGNSGLHLGQGAAGGRGSAGGTGAGNDHVGGNGKGKGK